MIIKINTNNDSTISQSKHRRTDRRKFLQRMAERADIPTGKKRKYRSVGRGRTPVLRKDIVMV